GTAERVMLKVGNGVQEDDAAGGFGDRPTDVPPNVDPTGANTGGPSPSPLYTLHVQPYPPAIDAQGNADCIKGQFGYPKGRLGDLPGRYRPVNGSRDPDGTFNAWARAHGGGGHVWALNNPPFLYDPTFTGLKNLSEVDSQH